MKMNILKFIILILCTLLGFIIALQIKSVKGEYLYVPLPVIHNYKLALQTEKKEIEQLQNTIKDINERIQEYKEIKSKGGQLKDSMLEELQEIKLYGGFLDVEGPGVVVILNDGTRELYEGENPNNVLIHDGDVFNILNDLKKAGAEAISINGQRIVSFSEISCAGYTIRINGQVFGQPFIIRAIGDPKTLEAAMVAPGTYGAMLVDVGLYVEVNTVLNLQIAKYNEELRMDHLQVINED